MVIKKAKKARTPQVYVVKTPNGERLVRAHSKQNAIQYVTTSDYTAMTATQADLIRLLETGV